LTQTLNYLYVNVNYSCFEERFTVMNIVIPFQSLRNIVHIDTVLKR